MIYRSDIDGLRALAILPVLLYHAGFQGFSGGFVGVDVFFVISGYLITSIVAQEIQEGRFSLLSFYERRARRLFPALAFVLAISCPVAVWLLIPTDLLAFARSLVTVLLFSSNILFWNEAGYFDSAAELKPLLHTWSLAVEEQFYIALPLLLLFLARKRRLLPWVLLGLASLSFAISAWGAWKAPTTAFYLPHSRAWELLLGSLLAVGIAPAIHSKRLRNVAAIAGLVLILVAVFTYSETTLFPGASALLPCLGAALIISAGERGSNIASRLLGCRPAVFIGRISYSLYLWHWPILAFAKYALARDLTGLEAAGALVLSLGVAVASWALIEQPFRERRLIVSQRRVFTGVAACSLAGFVGAASVHATDGLPQRFPVLPRKVAGREHWRPRECYFNPLGNNEDWIPEQWSSERCWLVGESPVRALLWGDSHAAHYGPGFQRNRDEFAISILQYTRALCPPVFGYLQDAQHNCESFRKGIPDIIAKFGIKIVIMASAWNIYPDQEVFNRQITETIDKLNDLGVKVLFIARGPNFNFMNPLHELQTRGIKNSIPLDLFASNKMAPDSNKRYRDAAVKADFFFDPLQTLCRPKECLFVSKGRILTIDPGHLSVDGSDVVIKDLIRSLRSSGDPLGILRPADTRS